MATSSIAFDEGNQNLVTLTNAAIDSLESIETEDVDEYIETLSCLFSENLLLAALDLVDQQNVIKIGTRWGHAQYQVLGSTATYSVFPGEGITPAYCTCPAFAYSVMLSKSEIMCKHLLATKVALRLSRQLERPASKGFLAQIAKERYSRDRASQA